MRKILFVISVLLFVLFLRLALKGVGNVDLSLLDTGFWTEQQEETSRALITDEQPAVYRHMRFQGTAINGTLNGMILKLTNKGYRVVEQHLNKVKMSGPLWGYEDSQLYVESCPVCMKVCRVTVCLPRVEHWNELLAQYNDAKSRVSHRYNITPTRCVERFTHPVSLYDERECEYAVKNGECQYISVFSVKGGRIEVEICNSLKNVCNCPFVVSVRFEDEANMSEKKTCINRR